MDMTRRAPRSGTTGLEVLRASIDGDWLRYRYVKKIEVIFPPSRIFEMREALAEHMIFQYVVSDVTDIAPKNARVFDDQGAPRNIGKKAAYKLELVTSDTRATDITETLSIVLIGYGADSKIIVTDVREVATH